MRLVDANLLVYAHVACFDQHPATTWLDDRLNGTTPLDLPWSSLLAFARLARLVSNPRIFERPAPIVPAWQHNAPASWHSLAHLLKTPNLRAAHLAALAIEHGSILCSTDTDFPLVNTEV